MPDEVPPPATVLQRVSDGGRIRRAEPVDLRFWRRSYAAHERPGLVVAALLGVAFAVQTVGGGGLAWGLSAQALGEGRWPVLGLHMIAHAGLAHLLLNLSALLSLSPIVLLRLGRGPDAWRRYGLLFVAAGLCGAAAFLALNPLGTVPMVGASGAICGLWGAGARVDPEGGLVSLRSRRVLDQIKAFAASNAVLFVVLFALVRLSGGQGGLAWEAHLGGFLFGLFAMPRLVPASERTGGEARPTG